MSNNRKPRTTKTTRRVTGGGGEQIPLVIPVPGGLAKFHKPGDLTPRQSRELEIIGAELLPRMAQLAKAQRVTLDGQTVDASDVLDGPPVGLSRNELRSFFEFQEACAWAFLESWTVERPMPQTPDDFADLPRDLYDAVIAHASKLAVTSGDVGFTVDALPADGDADPDLPTSPSAA